MLELPCWLSSLQVRGEVWLATVGLSSEAHANAFKNSLFSAEISFGETQSRTSRHPHMREAERGPERLLFVSGNKVIEVTLPLASQFSWGSYLSQCRLLRLHGMQLIGEREAVSLFPCWLGSGGVWSCFCGAAVDWRLGFAVLSNTMLLPVTEAQVW